MAILIGLKKIKTRRINAPHLICKNCGNGAVIKMQCYQQYYHFLKIPVVPIRETVVAECRSCKFQIRRKKMDSQYRVFSKKLRRFPPAWRFIGIAMLLLMVLYIWKRQ